MSQVSPTGGPSSDENDPGKAWTAQNVQHGTPYSGPLVTDPAPDTVQPQEMPTATPQSVSDTVGDKPSPGAGETGSIKHH